MGPCIAYCLCSRVGSVAAAVPAPPILCFAPLSIVTALSATKYKHGTTPWHQGKKQQEHSAHSHDGEMWLCGLIHLNIYALRTQLCSQAISYSMPAPNNLCYIRYINSIYKMAAISFSGCVSCNRWYFAACDIHLVPLPMLRQAVRNSTTLRWTLKRLPGPSTDVDPLALHSHQISAISQPACTQHSTARSVC